MNHFEFRDGVLHAEDVPVPEIARVGRHAVLLLLDRHAGAPLQRLPEVLRRPRRAGLLRHEGEFQPGGDRHAGAARRRRRRGLRGRDAPRARGGHSGRQDPVLRRRQDRARDGLRAVRRHPLLQRRIRAGTRTPVASAPSPPARSRPCRCASIRMSTPGRTRRSRPAMPRTSSALPAQRARDVYAPRRKPAGHPGYRHRHAYRQPDHRSAALRRRLRAAGRAGRDAARRRPRDRAHRFRRRARRALSRRQRSAAAPGRLCRHRPPPRGPSRRAS